MVPCALSMESDVPTGAAITKYYVGGFQDAPVKASKTNKVLHLFVKFSTPKPVRELKCNIGFFTWLKNGKYFMCTHGFTSTNDIASARFISMMSPTRMHCHNTVNEIIQEEWKTIAPDVEIHLFPHNILYGKG
jgi:hypothetical protein